MSETLDELAGVVDLFGALTPEELERALAELAFKQGETTDDEAFGGAVERAVGDYYLVEVDPGAVDAADRDPTDGAPSDEAGRDDPSSPDGEPFLTVGPVAFPVLPEGAEDLPHILDVPERRVDREAAAERVARRLLADAARAADAGETGRVEHLLDVSYDLEAWADVDVRDARDRLGEALEDKPSERQ